MRLSSTWVHGENLWIRFTIWVRQTKLGWYARVELPDGGYLTYDAPQATQQEAEDQLCRALNTAHDAATDEDRWR